MTAALGAVRADPLDTEVLQQHWISLVRGDADTAAVLRERLGVDFAAAGERVWETGDFLYLPVVVHYKRGDAVERETLVFALGSEFLVTLQPAEHFPPFDKGIVKMLRTPALTGSACGVMYALLWALNETSERVVEHVGELVDGMSPEIAAATSGHDRHGRGIGIAEMRATTARMDAAEGVATRVRETQLRLARAARHLKAEVPAERRELHDRLALLVDDIEGVHQHAGLVHDRVRHLQRSVATWLEVQQNQIVRVFTVVTAVFLPPTLITTFYGMNFTWMAEGEWQHGFLVTTLMMIVAAVIPLVYLEKKGWLR